MHLAMENSMNGTHSLLMIYYSEAFILITAAENIEMGDEHWVLKRATADTSTNYSPMVPPG